MEHGDCISYCGEARGFGMGGGLDRKLFWVYSAWNGVMNDYSGVWVVNLIRLMGCHYVSLDHSFRAPS